MSAEKKIRDFSKQIEGKQEVLDLTQASLDRRKADLQFKQAELSEIEKENEEEITKLNKERETALKRVEERLSRAYHRIRENMKNSVAVAPIVRGSCGGCFSKIPPQRHSDIRAHIKITDCEHCGRILVDQTISGISAFDEIKEDKPTRRKMRLTTAK
jgi:predicted  nucleic acid-binding Zn-ribbon protein